MLHYANSIQARTHRLMLRFNFFTYHYVMMKPNLVLVCNSNGTFLTSSRQNRPSVTERCLTENSKVTKKAHKFLSTNLIFN